jgi:hypothetical protein
LNEVWPNSHVIGNPEVSHSFPSGQSETSTWFCATGRSARLQLRLNTRCQSFDSKCAWLPPHCTDTIPTQTCHRMDDRRPAAEVAMNKNARPDKAPQTSREAPFTSFIQLDRRSTVPSQFHVPGNFTITRLQSPTGLPNRITLFGSNHQNTFRCSKFDFITTGGGRPRSRTCPSDRSRRAAQRAPPRGRPPRQSPSPHSC